MAPNNPEYVRKDTKRDRRRMMERNRGIKKLCSFVGGRIKKTKVGGYITKKVGNCMKRLITYCLPNVLDFSKIPFWLPCSDDEADWRLEDAPNSLFYQGLVSRGVGVYHLSAFTLRALLATIGVPENVARKRAGLHILAALDLIASHRDQGERKRIICDLDLGELPRILFPVYLALWGEANCSKIRTDPSEGVPRWTSGLVEAFKDHRSNTKAGLMRGLILVNHRNYVKKIKKRRERRHPPPRVTYRQLMQGH